MTDLATLTAILYAGRCQRRLPESNEERRRTMVEAAADAQLIINIAAGFTKPKPPGLSAAVLTETDSPVTLPELEQPPPSPGTIGRIADVKATRRRGQSGVRPATEA